MSVDSENGSEGGRIGSESDQTSKSRRALPQPAIPQRRRHIFKPKTDNNRLSSSEVQVAVSSKVQDSKTLPIENDGVALVMVTALPTKPTDVSALSCYDSHKISEGHSEKKLEVQQQNKHVHHDSEQRGFLQRVRQYRLFRASYIRNAASFLIFTALFVLVNVAMFVVRVMKYSNKHWLEQIARGTGFCLNFDCALVLVLVLRRMLTWLRSNRIGQLLPLEHHIYLHKMVGWTVYVFSIVHTLCHMANFVMMSGISGVSVYDYLFDTSMNIGWFVGSANITGIALLAVLTVMVVCSHRAVRKSGYFEVFYWTHLLSIPTWVLLILHSPNFWKWFLVPGFLFIVEVVGRMKRICSQRGRSYITSAVAMPSDVVKLTVQRPHGFRFHAGDFCYLNIPSVAKYEWHPFTISSSPENSEELTFHVRAVGEWTRSLHNKVITACVNAYLSKQFVLQDKSTINSTTLPPYPLVAALTATPQATEFPDERDVTNLDRSCDVINNSDHVTVFTVSDGDCGVDNEHSGAVKNNNNNNHNNDKLKQLINSVQGDFRTKEQKLGCHENSAFQSTEDVDQSSRVLTHNNTVVLHVGDCGERSSWPSYSSGIYTRSSLEKVTGRQGQPTRRRKRSVIQHGQAEQLRWRVVLDGPFGAPCTSIFHSEHAVMVSAGIGATPFASVLHCISDRYNAAHRPCPHCSVPTCLDMPSSLLRLRKVDFVWVNRDMRSFEWFLELLHELLESQRRPGSALEEFLTVQLYKTSTSPLVAPVPLRNEVKQGRPDWDQVFGEIRRRKRGRVSVFYCGPPALAPIIRGKSIQYGFAFVKEMF